MELTQRKAALRERIWRLLEERGVARFPLPLKNRVPNFAGAERTAERLRELPEWKDAKLILANPDSAQRPVRQAALEDGKALVVASPRLKAGYLLLKPEKIKGKERWAATIKGAFKFGERVAVEDVPKPDLIVTGCVAVEPKAGWRLGKGGGYGDVEIRTFLGRFGKIPVVTTVHELQVVATVPHGEGDTKVNVINNTEEKHSY